MNEDQMNTALAEHGKARNVWRETTERGLCALTLIEAISCPDEETDPVKIEWTGDDWLITVETELGPMTGLLSPGSSVVRTLNKLAMAFSKPELSPAVVKEDAEAKSCA